jgi:drug/metabolite transporter (DMT)-like permease
MYLIPLYNAALAWLLLGERLRYYHLIGLLLILPGVWLATVSTDRAPAASVAREGRAENVRRS